MTATKDLVIYMLKASKGFVSGEEMSERIGVSRMAVNAAVKALKSEEYEIESVTNKGYRLISGRERLSVGELLPYLDLKRAEQITVLESIGSTNTYLKELCVEGKAKVGACLIANSQTNGRGRLGRHFESESNVGIYLSYVLDPKDTVPSELSEITAWGAVAVREAIEEVCGVSCDIKWVNDLVYQTMKICGILTEISLEGESGRIQYMIMGIGINVNQEKGGFPSELSHIATSLKAICGFDISRAELCAAVIRKLDKLCMDFPKNRQYYLCEYRKHCAIIGKEVILSHRGEEKQGTALDIDEHFGLSVQYKNGGIETVTAGEVSVKGFYGVQA